VFGESPVITIVPLFDVQVVGLVELPLMAAAADTLTTTGTLGLSHVPFVFSWLT
jgi:hypothetical protein